MIDAKQSAMGIRFAAFAALCAGGLLAGCKTWDLDKAAWPPFAEEKPKTPAKVVATWTDAVRYRPDGSPQRGFGGRLLFYEAKGEKPIKVDGTLVVYAFDEEGRDPGDAKPDRKYVFPKESFDKHYSKSDLGNSYSVWIPWDDLGGMQKEVSLIVRFTPAEGPVIVSQQTRQLLPGTKPPQTTPSSTVRARPASAPPKPPVELASHQEPAGAGGTNGAGDRRRGTMITTTIPVRPQFGRPGPVAVGQAPRAPTPSIPTVGAGAAAGLLATPWPAGQATAPLQAQAQVAPLAPAAPPGAHYAPGGLPAPAGPTVPPSAAHGPYPPFPAASPYSLGSTPRSVQRPGSWSSGPAVEPVPPQAGWTPGGDTQSQPASWSGPR